MALIADRSLGRIGRRFLVLAFITRRALRRGSRVTGIAKTFFAAFFLGIILTIIFWHRVGRTLTTRLITYSVLSVVTVRSSGALGKLGKVGAALETVSATAARFQEKIVTTCDYHPNLLTERLPFPLTAR